MKIILSLKKYWSSLKRSLSETKIFSGPITIIILAPGVSTVGTNSDKTHIQSVCYIYRQISKCIEGCHIYALLKIVGTKMLCILVTGSWRSRK